jgi:hypothetical protein
MAAGPWRCCSAAKLVGDSSSRGAGSTHVCTAKPRMRPGPRCMPTTVKLRTHIAQVSLNAPALTRPSIGVAPFRGIHTQGYGPFLAARTYTLTRAQCPERTAGQSPVRRLGPHSRAHRATSRERSRTHAWAKPCLAGRPTMLVRTQCFETNTSRGRPIGMELPDYPVMALTPTPWDQDGPALRPPAGSFPGFVARYAPRRVFSRIRISLFFPPAFFLFLKLAPDSPRRLDHEFEFPFLLVPREQVPKHG